MWLLAPAFLGILLVSIGSTAPPPKQGLYAFQTRDGIALTNPDSSGTNPLFFWAELEATRGQFNWQPIDKAIADANAAGKKIVPRIYTNVDGAKPSPASPVHQTTPLWVFDLGAASYSTTRSAQAKLPLHWDPIFQQEFERFLRALAARYDGNPTIEFWQTNAGGGVYGELIWTLPFAGDVNPAGYTTTRHIEAAKWGIDTWRAAFQRSALAVMLNDLGFGIAEQSAADAVLKGFYLQSNSPNIGPSMQAIFRNNASKTRLSLEVEDGGCGTQHVPAFTTMINKVFGFGFALDYLFICQGSMSHAATAATLSSVSARLRQAEPSAAPTPSQTTTRTPTAVATATSTPIPPTATPIPLICYRSVDGGTTIVRVACAGEES